MASGCGGVCNSPQAGYTFTCTGKIRYFLFLSFDVFFLPWTMENELFTGDCRSGKWGMGTGNGNEELEWNGMERSGELSAELNCNFAFVSLNLLLFFCL